MKLSVHDNPQVANQAAAELLVEWFKSPGVRNVMLAAGNTPLEMYRLVAERKERLKHLSIYALDEYVGVPLDEPRNCANLIRRTAVEPWGIPEGQYFTVSSLETNAEASVREHERRIESAGGLDVVTLGLGQNGHLGFNEPGSEESVGARVLDLDPISVEANLEWFSGEYAPSRGVTTGLKTILKARRILLLAYGLHKKAAVTAMIKGPRNTKCPASLLQGHPNVYVFLDKAAASGISENS